MDPSLMKVLSDVAKEGIDCVCFTYAVHFIRAEWVRLPKAADKVIRGCEDIRQKFKTHKVRLSEEL
eukprot:3078610-Karenia_brevis.AAC.1